MLKTRRTSSTPSSPCYPAIPTRPPSPLGRLFPAKRPGTRSRSTTPKRSAVASTRCGSASKSTSVMQTKRFCPGTWWALYAKSVKELMSARLRGWKGLLVKCTRLLRARSRWRSISQGRMSGLVSEDENEPLYCVQRTTVWCSGALLACEPWVGAFCSCRSAWVDGALSPVAVYIQCVHLQSVVI